MGTLARNGLNILLIFLFCFSNKVKVETMNHLKKAAINITSKLGLLNTHRTLVIAISEEQKVYENMIKLVLARVNGKGFNKKY